MSAEEPFDFEDQRDPKFTEEDARGGYEREPPVYEEAKEPLVRTVHI